MDLFSRYLADSWRFFSTRLLQICSVLFPMLIPLQLAHIGSTRMLGEDNQLTFFVLSLSLVLYPIYHGAVISFIHTEIKGNEKTVSEHYRLALQLWMPMLIMYVINMVAVVAGLFLFIIPGLFVIARLSYCEFFCFIEKQLPFQAIVSSWEATEDRQWMLLAGAIVIWSITTLPILLMQEYLARADSVNAIALFVIALIAGIVAVPLTIFRYRVYSETR